MSKLFTIILSFHDHLVGIGQYEKDTPLDAVKEFIKLNESLKGYDRDLMEKSLMPLQKFNNIRGLWNFHFNPYVELDRKDGNPILGGYIIQTDPTSSSLGLE